MDEYIYVFVIEVLGFIFLLSCYIYILCKLILFFISFMGWFGGNNYDCFYFWVF